jgi:AraC family transcriptional regulator
LAVIVGHDRAPDKKIILSPLAAGRSNSYLRYIGRIRQGGGPYGLGRLFCVLRSDQVRRGRGGETAGEKVENAGEKVEKAGVKVESGMKSRALRRNPGQDRASIDPLEWLGMTQSKSSFTSSSFAPAAIAKRIDAEPFAPWTLDALAAQAGYSPYHFARIFAASEGVSPMDYVRRRRMAAAAMRIAREPNLELIVLALDCGFESQEAFTRAFKRMHGVPPGEFRRNVTLAQPSTVETDMTADATPLALILLDAPVARPASVLAGFKTQIVKMDNAHVPGLWGRLFQNAGKPGQRGWSSLGVCWADGDVEACVNYMAAFEWDPDAPVPEPFERMDLAAQTYRVFRLTMNGGPVNVQMQAAAKEIWGKRIPEAGWRLAKVPDLEVYSEDFRPDIAGVTVDFYVPVEG